MFSCICYRKRRKAARRKNAISISIYGILAMKSVLESFKKHAGEDIHLKVWYDTDTNSILTQAHKN